MLGLVLCVSCRQGRQLCTVRSWKDNVHYCVLMFAMPNSREGLLAVLGEHGRDDVRNDSELGLIGSSNIDEHVAGVKSNLAVLGVDDRWHRENPVFLIINDGIYRRVLDDMQISRKMLL